MANKKYKFDSSDVVAAKTGDEDATEKVLKGMRPMIDSMARRIKGNADFDDLKQAASIGVLRAIAGFDPARGSSFVSYARPFVLDETLRCATAFRSSPKIPHHAVAKVSSGKRNGHSDAVIDAVLASHGWKNGEQVRAALETVHMDAGDFEVWAEHVENPDIELSEDLSEAFGSLSQVEGMVVKLSFGLVGWVDLPDSEIGVLFDLTPDQVAEVRSAALMKIKDSIQGE